MKTTFEKIAAACVIVAFVVGMLLGSALFPAPAKTVEVAVPPAPERAEIPKPAEFTDDVPIAAQPAAPAALDSLPKPASQPQKLGYYYGVHIADGLRNQNLSLDAAYLARGMQDGYTGAQKLLSDQEMTAVISELQKNTGAAAGQSQETPQQAEAKRLAAEKAKQEADAFLAENAKKEGVRATASGLQYKIITEGEGPSPTDADSVTVHYRGTLLNGTEFDSSYKRNEPASFKVTGVIKGWTEALKMMKVGAKWQLWIPPDLAYGNSLLVFEVELLGINDQAKAAE